MSMWVCAELDSLSHCVEWVEQQSLVVPPLSIEDGVTLGGAMVLCWVIAWACRQLWQMIINR